MSSRYTAIEEAYRQLVSPITCPKGICKLLTDFNPTKSDLVNYISTSSNLVQRARRGRSRGSSSNTRAYYLQRLVLIRK